MLLYTLSPLDMSTSFVLLDDCLASESASTSRLYTEWVRDIVCDDPSQLSHLLQDVARAQQEEGLHATLVMDYEWGRSGSRSSGAEPSRQEDSVGALPAQFAGGDVTKLGLLRIGLFRSLKMLSALQVQNWLASEIEAATRSNPTYAAGHALAWKPALNEPEFARHIAQIHAAIEEGQTYQVNYTFAFHGAAYGNPMALYQQLRAKQPAEFGALIADDSGRWMMSFSPEMFVRLTGKQLEARPMKGTARAGDSAEQTQQRAQWLQEDEKNRAENVMIVDLLRNDMGRVAQIGSVQISDLFHVQQHGNVLQMTTRVTAMLEQTIGLAEVLQAIFPCGSITGAPKHQTMQIIDALEGQPRGVYTGAIGWLDALKPSGGNHAHPSATQSLLGNCCLSVPIRTLFLQEAQASTPGATICNESNATTVASGVTGLHKVSLPVGAGIVWSSDAAQEWQECLLKGEFATASDPGFVLFETMRVQAGRIANEQGHIARLQKSAQALGFRFDATEALHGLAVYVHSLGEGDWRLKLSLSANGAMDMTSAPLTPLPQGSVDLILWPQLCQTPHDLLAHKTSLRTSYDQALHAAIEQGAFDALFFNQHGLLTEGARSNVLVKIDGQWCTPRISDGALPGTLRAQLLGHPDWAVQERAITKEQLLASSEIAVCNALRGVLPAKLCF